MQLYFFIGVGGWGMQFGQTINTPNFLVFFSHLLFHHRTFKRHTHFPSISCNNNLGRWHSSNHEIYAEESWALQKKNLFFYRCKTGTSPLPCLLTTNADVILGAVVAILQPYGKGKKITKMQTHIIMNHCKEQLYSSTFLNQKPPQKLSFD